MEFLEANAKAIPIYVFVKSDVLTLLPIWKTNPQANFSSAVDSPKLFEFIDLLRAKKNLWVFPFKNAQEICSTLRRQLSYLLSDCLDFRSRLYPPDPVLGLLGPDSLRTYLEKPSYWEYLALAHCLRENIERHQSKRLDVELGISFGATIHLDDRQATVNWISKKISELGVVVDNFDRAFNTGVIPAVGPPGVPGDMTRIAHLAARFGEAYLSLLEWTLEFRRVAASEDLSQLLKLSGALSANAIFEIESFVKGLFTRLRAAIDSSKPGDKVEIILRLSMPDLTEFKAEMQRVPLLK